MPGRSYCFLVENYFIRFVWQLVPENRYLLLLSFWRRGRKGNWGGGLVFLSKVSFYFWELHKAVDQLRWSAARTIWAVISLFMLGLILHAFTIHEVSYSALEYNGHDNA